MDLIALVTLYLTLDTYLFSNLIVVFIFSLSIFISFTQNQAFIKIRSSRLFIFFVTFFSIAMSLVLWLKFHLPLIAAVASSAPILHASLWLMPENSALARTSQLRLALGFSELMITSILTSEVYLTLSLFAFTFLASFALSCGFIRQAFLENQEKDDFLNTRYLLSIAGIAFLVLMSAILIFPILPRTKINDSLESFSRQIGYTEQVSLDRITPLTGGRNGKILLKIYLPENSDINSSELATHIPWGLIRGRTLNQFDGTHWTSSPPKRQPPLFRKSKDNLTEEFRIDREPMDSDFLPIPYGTVAAKTEGNSLAPIRMKSGEWGHLAATGNRVRYRVYLQPQSVGVFYGSEIDDLPKKEHLFIPNYFETEGVRRLVLQIFHPDSQQKKDAESLVYLLKTYFNTAEFHASLGGLSSQSQLPALLDFLFISKEGNCELFASAAAILLRMEKIPTRLVTGFRITRSTRNSTLNIKSSDAHAWLEYWVEGKGWKVFDPTPRLIAHFSLIENLLDTYDSLENLWYHYFYSYDAGAQLQLGHNSFEKLRETKSVVFEKNFDLSSILHSSSRWLISFLWIFIILIFYFLTKFLKRLLSSQATDGPLRIQWARKKMEIRIQSLLKTEKNTSFDLFRQELKIKSIYGIETASIYKKWVDLYLKIRFRTSTDNSRDFRELKKIEALFRENLRF